MEAISSMIFAGSSVFVRILVLMAIFFIASSWITYLINMLVKKWKANDYWKNVFWIFVILVSISWVIWRCANDFSVIFDNGN